MVQTSLSNLSTPDELVARGHAQRSLEVGVDVLAYDSVCDYEEGFIPIFNRSSFSMFYSATVSAGVDAKDIKPEVTDTEVKLLLPACEIRDVNIDPTSVRFYDQEHGWLTDNGEREQVRNALEQAAEDVRVQDMSALLNLADEQLENMMKGLFEGVIGDRKLVIEHEKRTEPLATVGNTDGAEVFIGGAPA